MTDTQPDLTLLSLGPSQGPSQQDPSQQLPSQDHPSQVHPSQNNTSSNDMAETHQSRLKSQSALASSSAITSLPTMEPAPATQTCGKCDLQMKGSFVRALGSTFHLDCFKCMVGHCHQNTCCSPALLSCCFASQFFYSPSRILSGLWADCSVQVFPHHRARWEAVSTL